jgi:hypothetical protein
MEFKVIFFTKEVDEEKRDCVLQYDQNRFGLDFIKSIRDVYKNVRIEDINDYTSDAKSSNYTIKLTEDQIKRCSGRFLFNSIAMVEVPLKYLNKYQSVYYIAEILYIRSGLFSRLFGKGVEEVEISVYNNCKNDDIINDWIKDGCPLKWGFEISNNLMSMEMSEDVFAQRFGTHYNEIIKNIDNE